MGDPKLQLCSGSSRVPSPQRTCLLLDSQQDSGPTTATATGFKSLTANCRPIAPFCRFCLHDDLQRNVDLLATHLCTASSSSSSRGLTQPSLDPPSLQTQLRSKGTDGSLVVKFSSADAACRVMQRGEQLALMLLREAEESEDCDS
jgi:hypothetical protein